MTSFWMVRTTAQGYTERKLFPSLFTVVTFIFLAGYSLWLTGMSTTLPVRNHQHNSEHLISLEGKHRFFKKTQLFCSHCS